VTTTSTGFAGWHRQDHRQPWREVCRAGTEDEAWDSLLDHTAGGDKLILPVGENPNTRPSPLVPRRRCI
jgi:hypothetical protein